MPLNLKYKGRYSISHAFLHSEWKRNISCPGRVQKLEIMASGDTEMVTWTGNPWSYVKCGYKAILGPGSSFFRLSGEIQSCEISIGAE